MSDIKEQPAYTQQPVTEQQQPVTYQQQPAPQAQPGFAAYQAVTGTEEWSNGIFDCFENAPDNLCLKGTFCPCFVYGKTQARLRDPTLTGYDRFNADCLTWAGLSYCHVSWILTFLNRGQIRQNYAIKGDQVTDCLLSAFCGCCSIIQHEKEVLHKQAAGGIQQGYQAPVGMTTAPQ